VLLTITTTGTPQSPATDLGHLLAKHPDRVSEFPQSFGSAWVFFPEATAQRCTAALLLEIDPARLKEFATRKGGKSAGTPAANDASLAQYVNDRPYAASSLLAVTIGKVFRTARSGRSSARPELAAQEIPLEITIPVLPCRGGSDLAHRIFEPLGWQVSATEIPLDERFPDWGPSRYLRLTLRGNVRLADALNQLYVLLPVFDESKHYWQSDDEVDKLLRAGSGWLETHPEREFITRGYLARSSDLTRAALDRLAELDDAPPGALADADEEAAGANPEPLRIQRQRAVLAELNLLGAASVLDLGCGSGALLAELIKDSSCRKIVGTDVSMHALKAAAKRLHLDEISDRQAERIELFQSALTYEDPRLAGFDAAVLMEVIEHVDLARLPALERCVFGVAKPKAILVTTPNVEFNARYPGLSGHDGDGMRHSDHRFEWTREEFSAWARRVGQEYGYDVEFRAIGTTDPDFGGPTQMAVFNLGSESSALTKRRTKDDATEEHDG